MFIAIPKRAIDAVQDPWYNATLCQLLSIKIGRTYDELINHLKEWNYAIEEHYIFELKEIKTTKEAIK